MNVQKTACLLAAIGTMLSLGMATTQAAVMKAATKSASMAAPAPVVVVKLGEALLEEYYGGNPDQRTTTVRGHETAQNAKPADTSKKHS